MHNCKSLGCERVVLFDNEDFCDSCKETVKHSFPGLSTEHPELFVKLEQPEMSKQESLSTKYPKYYKSVGNLKEIDVYAVHSLFNIQDPSGAIQHASKKLLLSGVRTGKKSAYEDIKEARDTLTRWLQLNEGK